MNEKILVNKDHPCLKIDQNQLKKVTNCLGQTLLLEKRTLKAYFELKERLASKRIEIDLASGYRTFEEQQKIREEFQEQYGLDYVEKYVARAGESEHHTGLCFDVFLRVEGKDLLENEDLLAKEREPLWQEIKKNLSSCGLILRYPKEKERLTGYAYEPWHYRYVGKSTAQRMEKEHLCLEEYDQKYHRSGILLVNKPQGLTSREVVNHISSVFDTKKVGHTGTLDPLATGVLVVTVNQATKVSDLLMSATKEYLAEVVVGKRTDTLDIEGKVLEEGSSLLDQEKLKEAFRIFPREYNQEVPLYSAKKVKGKKLYQYAREGKEVEIPRQHVILYELELLEIKESSFRFRALVSKGIYIRSLIRDLGTACQSLFTMSALTRTKQGNFTLDQCYSLEEITVDTPLLKIGEALSLKEAEIKKEDQERLLNGHPMKNTYGVVDKVVFLCKGQEIAIYQREGEELKSYKKLNSI